MHLAEMRHNSLSQLDFDFKKDESGSLYSTENLENSLYFNGTVLSGRKDKKSLRVYINNQNHPRSFKRQELLPYYIDIWSLLENYYSNPLYSAVTSNTMLLPHQVQAATRIVSSVRPRFLIADEVGLGKTIEAGLILKELILKFKYKRIMILVPSPLLYQWQNELKSKFNEEFDVLTGKELKKNESYLNKHMKVIASIDLVKNPEYKKIFHAFKYDLLVFDEAHRLRRDQNRVTKAYQFAADIIDCCVDYSGAVILLSATPFRGKIEEIYYLIQLLDKDILGPISTFLKLYNEGKINLRKKLEPVVLRRRKVDVGGFTKRFAKTLKVELNSLERAFYDETNEYVKREYNMAMAQGSHIKSFIMIIFQKLLDSSNFALLTALKRRKAKLENLYFNPHEITPNVANNAEIEESESSVEMVEVFDPAQIRQEVQAIIRLITLGSKIQRDSKLELVKDTILKIKAKGHEKIIIFTQFKSTLDTINRELSKSYKVSIFHGQLSAQEKEDAIERFYQDHEILICTEAGGEGRNLQVASALINYDLPWSPLKIEQRIGRVHRFGQKKDVYIFNLACKDTVAEKVIEILEKKIQLFEEALGPSDTLLGTLEDDKSFFNSIIRFLKKKKTKSEEKVELDRSLNLAQDNLEKIDQLISTEFLDYDMQAFQKVSDGRLKITEGEEKVENVILGYMRFLNYIPQIKNHLLEFNLNKLARKGCFNSEYANSHRDTEYLAMGHPYVDRIFNQVMQFCKNGLVVLHREASELGALIEVHFDYDKLYKRFFSMGLNTEKKFEPIYVECSQKQVRVLADKVMRQCYFLIAKEREKIESRAKSNFSYWHEQIENAHSNAKGEIEEKLEIQKSKLKWYGEKKMAGAIQRNINLKTKKHGDRLKKLSKINHAINGKVNVYINKIIITEEILKELNDLA